MTQEEKLEEAKRLYETANADQKYVLERLFPELKESEDKRNWKILYQMIHYNVPDSIFQHHKLNKDKFECWLEKQGEPIDREKVLIGARKDIALSIMNYLDNNSVGMCLSNMECEDIEDACVNSKWTKLYNYMKKKLEKQGEQKSLEEKADLEKAMANILEVYALTILCRSLTQDELNKTDAYAIENTKKLLDYFVQRKQLSTAWSEEDEKILQGIWDEILANKHNAKECEWKTYDRFLDWLKSLKDKCTWKPSDEQIKVCKEVYADLLSAKGFDVGAVNSELNRLEEQLKNL